MLGSDGGGSQRALGREAEIRLSQSWEERYRELQEKGAEGSTPVEVPWVEGAPPVPDPLAWEEFVREWSETG